MPSLPDLPPELRQHILLFALPDTNRIDAPWPTQIISLCRINHRLRLDMGPVINMWSPVHYVSFPSSLSALQPQTLSLNGRIHAPRVARICLDLFHESDATRIQWKCYSKYQSEWRHPELIAAWTEAVPLLPQYVQQVWLDVTPAPAAKRDQHRLVLRQFVCDKYASRKFMGGHVEDVSMLVRQIDERYRGNVKIVLTGTLSTKSRFFVDSLSMRFLEFVGTWVSSDDARFARISDNVRVATSRKQMWPGKRRGDKNPLAWLRVVTWDRKTGFLFARLADEGLEEAAIDDLKRIAEFHVDRSELALPPARNLRRAFQHRVAADVGLKTVGEGEGDGRHVVVRW